MQNRKQVSLLACVALLLLMSQTLWGQFVVKIDGTDGSGIIDTLTLAVDAAGTAGYDSLSPTLREYEIPVPAKGLDFRVASNFPADVIGLGSYTSIHHMAYPTQTDKWKLQFNVDSGRTSFLVQWPAGLGSIGGGYWRLQPDPDDVITFSEVDMAGSTSLSIPVTDIEPHTFYIVRGDGQKYRSFTSTEIVNAVDAKGKHVAAARKAIGSQGTFVWTNTLSAPETSMTGIHIEWSQMINTALLSISPPVPPSDIVWVDPGKFTKVNISFTGRIHTGDAVTIFAIGAKSGKALQAKKWWWTANGVMYPPKVKNLAVNPADGLLRYPMPNIHNVGLEAYSQLVFTTNGLVVGNPTEPAGFDAKSKPFYKAVIHPKWGDVLKTLSDKTGMQTGAAKCLDNFATTKPILKVQKSLPPNKHSNKLLAEAVALKFNIGASEAWKMEQGGTTFGFLNYVPQPGDPEEMPDVVQVFEIARKLDSVMSCQHTTWDAAGPVSFDAWYNMVYRINSSFSGPFDTLSFIAPIPPPHAKTAGTVVTGVRPIVEVPYLFRASFAESVPAYRAPDIAALEARSQPQQYQLMQNYPNPFNPMTTIEFAMPEDGMVTMKVYNILGQEVATLIDNELLNEGTNEVTFDASTLSSGVYYYQMIVNDGQFRQVKKMMLVK